MLVRETRRAHPSVSMSTASQRLLAARARSAHRPIAMASSAAPAAGGVGNAERPTRKDPHWGPLDVPDEPPEIILVEEQHGQPEPPSQKPPMWFIQVHDLWRSYPQPVLQRYERSFMAEVPRRVLCLRPS